MRYAASASIAAVLVLAGCGQQENDSAASAKAGADSVGGELAAADDNFQIKAGQYRSTVSMQKMSAEGFPVEMSNIIPKQQTFDYCISEADAAAGIDGVKKQMAQGKCKYESFAAAGGKVEAVFSCESMPGMQLRSSAKGTYSDNGSLVAVVADMTMPGGKSMHIEQTVKAERIGDCAK